MNYTKEELLEYYQNYFNNQEGQYYPGSNQIVSCAIITHDKELAKKVMKEKGAEKLRSFSKFELHWKLNNEYWIWKSGMINPNCRGYRFYKVVVDKNLTKKEIIEYIIPKCAHYCCSFEVI